MIVIVLIVIIVAAAATAYYVVFASSSTTSESQTSTQGSNSSSSQPSSSTPVTTSTVISSTTLTIGSTTSTSGAKTYNGTFQFTNPAGPFGELTFTNNDTVRTYNSVQVGSGSFTFSLNPGNTTGSGTGKGTLTVTTTGFCSGRTTLSYTFGISDVALVGANITVFIGDPTPVNFTVPLTCTVQPNPGSTNGDTFPFIAIYPNELSVPVLPASVNENFTGGISYQFTISPTN